MIHAVLADVTVVAHGLYVRFAVGGEVAVLLGGLLRAPWTRNRRFRNAHLAAVVLVAVEALLGAVCPLTEWEYTLRTLAGQRVERQMSFVARLVRAVIYYDLPPWAFTAADVSFAALAAVTFVLLPPRKASRRDTTTP